MSFLANTSSNYSLYMIPAFWVMNISTHLWAISSFDALPQNKNKKWDNASPRAFLSNLSKKENHSRDEAMIVRAEAAQQNGFENIGLFGVAVLAGNFAHLPAGTLNVLAASYLATRALYTLLYINTEGYNASYARSVTFVTGVGICFTLIIKAANVLY